MLLAALNPGPEHVDRPRQLENLGVPDGAHRQRLALGADARLAVRLQRRPQQVTGALAHRADRDDARAGRGDHEVALRSHLVEVAQDCDTGVRDALPWAGVVVDLRQLVSGGSHLLGPPLEVEGVVGDRGQRGRDVDATGRAERDQPLVVEEREDGVERGGRNALSNQHLSAGPLHPEQGEIDPGRDALDPAVREGPGEGAEEILGQLLGQLLGQQRLLGRRCGPKPWRIADTDSTPTGQGFTPGRGFVIVEVVGHADAPTRGAPG